MTTLTRQGCEFIENTLVKAAAYSGNMEPGKKQISASQLGNDTLQLYLKYKHGGKESIIFDAATFGSIYHLGAEYAFKDIDTVETEKSLSYELSNGWLVTGSIDLIDHKHKLIVDHKTTTATSIASTQKEGKNSSYGLQQSVYRWLLKKNYDLDYSAILAMVDKNFSYFKDNKFNQINFIEIDTHTIEDTEQLLLDKTNELQSYIDLDQEPGQCQNLFWYARKGQKRKAMKCLHYCDQSQHCPYFSDFNAVKDLLMGL